VREDSGTQLSDAGVRSAFERFVGEQTKEAFHEVEPRGVGWCEMKLDARMTQQPALHRWRAMRREIVEDDVDVETALDTRFDLAQKRHEILRPMLGCAPGEHFAGRHIECGEQIQGAMTHVVVGRRSGWPKSIGRMGCARWSA